MPRVCHDATQVEQPMTSWWQSLFQTTVDAYYAGNLDIGLHTCERLLSVDGLPPEIERQTRRNLVFYAPKLSDLVARTARSQIALPVPGGWSCFNPSIAAGPDGLGVGGRCSNYRLAAQRGGAGLEAGGIIGGTNYLV